MKFQELQDNLTTRGFKCYSPDDGGHYYFEIPNQGTVPNNAFYFAEFISKVQRIDIYPSYNYSTNIQLLCIKELLTFMNAYFAEPGG